MNWYLVKINWPATEQVSSGYAGLGGDVWPLDGASARAAAAIHAELMAARKPVDLRHSTEMLCQSIEHATRYEEVCSTANPEGPAPIVLEVGLPGEGEGHWDGYDIGSASGGYSLIEAEVLHAGRRAKHNRLGLFDTPADAIAYLASRREAGLEDADQLEICGVRVIGPRHGRRSGEADNGASEDVEA